MSRASELARAFSSGFEAITRMPEFAEYLCDLPPAARRELERELLAYTAYTLSATLLAGGYLGELAELEQFMESFVEATGRWDEELYGRVDLYRRLDAERGEVAGAASALRFARYAAAAIGATDAEGGEATLLLTELANVFLLNYINPVLARIFSHP